MKAGKWRRLKHGASSLLDWDARLMLPNTLARTRAHVTASMTDENNRRAARSPRFVGISTIGTRLSSIVDTGYRSASTDEPRPGHNARRSGFPNTEGGVRPPSEGTLTKPFGIEVMCAVFRAAKVRVDLNAGRQYSSEHFGEQLRVLADMEIMVPGIQQTSGVPLTWESGPLGPLSNAAGASFDLPADHRSTPTCGRGDSNNEA